MDAKAWSMTKTLYDLLQHCTVKLSLNSGVCGTGFIVAPGYLLTCEHVVRQAVSGPISLHWQQQNNFAQGYVAAISAEIDIALVKYEASQLDLPCVYLDDRDVAVGDRLYLFGYPNDPAYSNGCPITPECEGFTGDKPPFIMLEKGQFQPGMSGAALLSRETGKVCGVAKFTRDQRNDLGGGGIKMSVILEQFPELREWQQEFHQRNRRWQQFLNQLDISLPLPKAGPNNLPRSGSVKFVGRDIELLNLHTQLHQNEQLTIVAIQGMGGIGKTELALQYAQHHRNQNTYPGGICWLNAKDQDVGSELVSFATTQLGLKVPTDLDLNSQAQFCWRHWPVEGDVLVVIDDVIGPNDSTAYWAIRPYLPPQEPRFWVLLTTRLQLVASIRSFQIGVLSEAAALKLLESLVGQERVLEELETAKALCHWLGYLPLALELGGRFLQRKQSWSLARMQQRLEQKRLEAKALCNSQPDMTSPHESVAAAFELSWHDLQLPVQELAYRLCLYALAPIPWKWIEDGYDDIEPDALEDWRDEGLVYRSMLRPVDRENQTFELHQLIHEFFRSKLEQWPEADILKKLHGQKMSQSAQEISETPTRAQILQVAPTIPHLAEASTTWQQWLDNESLIWSFISLGRFYSHQGLYEKAICCANQYIETTKNRLGDAHPCTANAFNSLGILHLYQGQYKQAESALQNALELRMRILEPEHTDIAQSLNNLGVLYRHQGDYCKAEEFLSQALDIRVQLFGENHVDVAESRHNIAGVYLAQKEYPQAEEELRKALELRVDILGTEDPCVAQSFSNLGELCRRQRRYREAQELLSRALDIRIKVFGKEHPHVAKSLNNIAALHASQRRFEEARRQMQEALDMLTEHLGSEHPDTISTRESLRNICIDWAWFNRR